MKTEDNKNMSLKITALVEKARDGNRPSFQDLVTIFQEDIYRLAYYRTFSQMDAEDLTQEVFEQAYRKLNSLNDPQRFRAWLYSIAVNRCNDFLRKQCCINYRPWSVRFSPSGLWTTAISMKLPPSSTRMRAQ
jgi:DNA-directed RNA polymerase specialized sigma24 family protein